MNKKIFTLLVGAIMLIGSAFTVNAQVTTLPYTPKPTGVTGMGTVNFSDVLTADIVTRLYPEYRTFNYLLGVVGVANPLSNGDALNTSIADPQYGSSYVLTIDDYYKTAGSIPEARYLQIENLALLDKLYQYPWNATEKATDPVSTKFGALRRALWCVEYDGNVVPGSNIIYDFKNMETGQYLKAPYSKGTWAASVDGNKYLKYGTGSTGTPLANAINNVDADAIVMGWHFSQTYMASQDLQQAMPLYSYVSVDTVEVLVLADDAAYKTPVVATTGGFPVTVKRVAVSDLIVDAIGNVKPGVINNVLLFSLKKANRFVMNANDWNALNKASSINVSFNDNATTTVTNTNNGQSYLNPFLDNSGVWAYEVNDSLYHYGYMQFQTKGGAAPYKDNFIYVDTAWVNYGNTQYLAFGWGARRDNTTRKATTSLAWGDKFEAATLPKCAHKTVNGVLDSVPYVTGCAPKADTVFWRLDSLIWKLFEKACAGNTAASIPPVEPWNYINDAGTITFYSAPFDKTLTLILAQEDIDAIIEIGNQTLNLASLGLVETPSFTPAQLASITGLMSVGMPINLFLNGTTTVGQGMLAGLLTPDGFQVNKDYRPRPGALLHPTTTTYGYTPVGTGFYVAESKAYRSYKTDSVAFIWAYMKDSIMENQSKFRVVYDPTYDSTFINVYQTRVRYPDFTNGSHNATWPAWWTNSFGMRTWDEPAHPYASDPAFMIRPSDLFTGTPYSKPTISGTTPIENASWYYFQNVRPLLDNLSPKNASDQDVTPSLWGWTVEGHGKGTAGTRITTSGNTSIFNFHSFMEYYPQSSLANMDKVLISTADTTVLYYKTYQPDITGTGTGTTTYYQGLSHMYGWTTTTDGQLKYRDSLFYVDLQDLGSNGNKIITLDQSYRKGAQKLDTQIKINFGPRCDAGNPIVGAKIESDLYLIRNLEGQYLSVPISSITDSIYWVTPEPNEDLTKMPSYQWAIISYGTNAFRMVNREFKYVDIPYASVSSSATGSLFTLAAPYSNASFNKKLVRGRFTTEPLQQNVGYDAVTFVKDIEKRYPVADYSFIKLGKTVKEDQTIGYKYINNDDTYIDVYAFKFNHFQAKTNPVYLSWKGYKTAKDTVLYANGTDYYDKLFFSLQEMESKEIKDNCLVLTYDNTKNAQAKYWLYKPIYDKANLGERIYRNTDSVVMEAFGINDPRIYSAIKDLRPMARQAYRLFLQDYYRWHPTLKGHYLVVGEEDRYVLADKANATVPYKKGTGKVAGLFGVPHFYFRETLFDIDKVKGDDYFAIVQRIDTATTSLSLDGYNTSPWGLPDYGDIQDYMQYRYGIRVAGILLNQIARNRELGLALLDIEPATGRAKFVLRGDGSVITNVSAFQLEKDEEPIYRRFHVNEPIPWYPNLKDQPDTVEFHLLNNGIDGYRLFENSGNYLEAPDDQVDQFQQFGRDGGRVYNRTKDGFGKYYRDTCENVISFLGMNNSYQYGYPAKDPGTNYAFFLDTAYINRGTGWIKPQYLIAVDPYFPGETPDCDPTNGEDIIHNTKRIVLARYLYNAAQYAKSVKGELEHSNKTSALVDVTKITGVNNKEGLVFSKRNFSKVEPIIETVLRTPNGAAYTKDPDHKDKWERLAFAWAIHYGDRLYVLKGVEPAYGGNATGDPKRLWDQLVKEYGGTTIKGKFLDFDLLESANRVTTFDEAYWPLGDRSRLPEIRTYNIFKPYVKGGKIGLQAIIELDDNTHKDWVFSFRYIERGSNDFVIESETTERDIRNAAIIRPGAGGWIKIDNGVPVITRSDEKDNMGQASGAVMNVKRLNNPVGNEEVKEAAASLQVIGGTGSVAIFNAAGKKVMISNILGQTIANVTLTSDDASIAAPAGIVVVSVEGEAVAKVIVK